MRDLEAWSEDGRYGVRIGGRALSRLLREARLMAPAETGGILVGHYDDQRLAVVTAVSSAPEDSSAGPTWFRRGTRGLQRWIGHLWRQTPRRYYLGEWHTHPGTHPIPSETDVEQITAIAANEGYRCPEPLLLIVGGDARAPDKVRCFVYPRFRCRVDLNEGGDTT